MGNCLAKIYINRKVGGLLCPLPWGNWLFISQNVAWAEAYLSYLRTKWYPEFQPFGHNSHGLKSVAWACNGCSKTNKALASTRTDNYLKCHSPTRMANYKFRMQRPTLDPYTVISFSTSGCEIMDGGSSAWFQRELFIKPRRRGCHLITDEIEKLEEIKNIKIGLCHVLSKQK